MYRDLRSFVAALDAAGEIRRITAHVSPILEISAAADAESKKPAPNKPSSAAQRVDPRFAHLGGHALLFENVQGSDFPVLINAYGSYRRMEIAMGCSDPAPNLAPGHTPGGFEALAAHIASLVKPEPPKSFRDLVAKARQFLPLLKIPPKRRRGSGPCQQVVITGDKLDLTTLPIIRCWPQDGDFESVGYPAGVNNNIPGIETGPDWNANFRGRYITLAGIHTIHADDINQPKPASHNIGMYRVQLLGKRHMAMHWHMHHDGARHWRSWKARGERMPVAIVLGGESVLPYSGTAPLPPGISELLMAGYLNRSGIPLVRAKTVPLWIPSNAEIVIEGYVSSSAGLIDYDPRRDGPIGEGAVFEGPFGDHTGFYSLPDRYPILEVTAITHRQDAIYPTTVVGLPPQEDYFLGKATERLFLPLLKVLIPDVEDYDLPMFGAFHNCAFVKIKKHYPFHARRVMHSIWGAGQMAWTKSIVVVDDDVDVHDTTAVLKAVGEHCIPARDTETVNGPLDILDHAAPFLGAGGKFGLDATRKNSGAELHRAQGPLAAELCAAGPINAVIGEVARTAEARIRQLEGVLDASIPEALGGWWLFIRISKTRAGDGARLITALGALPSEVEVPRWTIVVGPDADAANFDNALFHWLAQSAPDRDRYLSKCGRRVAFDATPKLQGDERSGLPVRDWPPILTMPPAITNRVQQLL